MHPLVIVGGVLVVLSFLAFIVVISAVSLSGSSETIEEANDRLMDLRSDYQDLERNK